MRISDWLSDVCSSDLTPPPQALGWLLDLYESELDLVAHGQTVVYAIHDKIGHLGIFVSGSVARKEHEEFAENRDLIDVLPPGLRSEERRVGKECVSTCRSRGARLHSKKKTTNN